MPRCGNCRKTITREQKEYLTCPHCGHWDASEKDQIEDRGEDEVSPMEFFSRFLIRRKKKTTQRAVVELVFQQDVQQSEE